MNSFFSAFDKSSLSQWKDQIIKDLKGKEHSILEFNDSIEEIDYNAYYHQEEIKPNSEAPGNFPFKRGHKVSDNNWSNATLILVDDEAKANKEALEVLMKGADMLVFKPVKEHCNWSKVLNEIQFEYIKAQFIINTVEDYQAIKVINSRASICYDHFAIKNEALFNAIVEGSKIEQSLSFEVNGFAVQRSGATTWQEIAFCLNVGHEYLVLLMNAGLTIDEASALIHFHIGVGSNYFNEIAKFRTMRELWSKVIQAYNPQHNCTYNCNITAVIGHLNKSLRDPYTNLLRQTTEAMSALNGADNIFILPYDLFSVDGASERAKRMAINISLILKEESYMDKVIDPTGGSYSIENLTRSIGEKAWEYFQLLESKGGLFNSEAIELLTTDIENKKNQRIKAFQAGEITGIGMNKYPDPNEKSSDWVEQGSYLGMEPLLFDLESKNIAV